jgi:hypothetical protein
VREPFEPAARFDEEGFVRLAHLAVRMPDNVLDVTCWPLERQHEEARSKRRIGLGFTGLGDALVMLNLRYDSAAARDAARRIAELLRDAAYNASLDLAGERGAFPLFNADLYLSRGTFASIRGFQGSVRARMEVRAQGPGDLQAQCRAGLSTDGGRPVRRAGTDDDRIRTPERAPGAGAHAAAAAGVAALARASEPAGTKWGMDVHGPASLRRVRALRRRTSRGRKTAPFEVWVNGAEQPRGLGALAKTLSMDLRAKDAAWMRLKLDVLATVQEERAFEMPFPPHGEMRRFPGVVAATAAVIRWRCEQLGLWQGDERSPTPVIDAMFSREEPQTGANGTLAWAVEVHNPASDESFTLTLKEVLLPVGQGGRATRPCALGLSGNYPRALDGLVRILSLDMRVLDPAWIGIKLR